MVLVGPSDREHGLSGNQFAEQRQCMRSNITHVFVLRRIPLNTKKIVDLYGKAMELLPPR
jgi:hypothetical protein